MRATHAPGLEVRRGRRGRGVFATRRFREGEVVESCPAVEIVDDETDGVLRDYVFAGPPGKSLLVLGYGMLYNHAAQPNLVTQAPDRLTVEFVALRDIEPGEELTHDYGADYWNDRNRRPR